jgi:lipopolysaccharide export system permease protein
VTQRPHVAREIIQLIIERYIHREILNRLLWITLLLLLIFTTNKFVEYLGDAAAGKIPPDYVFRFLWLKLLAVQPELMPLLIFLAVILAFSRLNQDNELAVLAAAGIGKRQQLKFVMRFCTVFAVLAAFVAFYAAPWAKLNIARLKEQAWQEVNITGLSAGKFKELSKGKSVVYIENLSDKKGVMENVFLQIIDRGKNSVVKSDIAYFDIDEKSGNRFIVFEKGRRYLGQPGMLDFQITEYDKYGVLLEESESGSEIASTESASMLFLLTSELPIHRAELQWRISSVILCILLAILGVLLNQYPFGQKPFTLLLFGILIYFIYNNLLSISRTMLERDQISSWIGLWWVHIVLIAVISVIYQYHVIIRRLKSNHDIQVLPAEK